MKKIYEKVEVEIILMPAEDIVTLSDNARDDVGNDIFEPKS